MNYKNMTIDQLYQLKFEATKNGNLEAAVEIADFINFFGKRVAVVKGKKVPVGTSGTVFYVKRSIYGNSVTGTTRIGFETEDERVYWTDKNNLQLKGVET
jgi:hypothetical protein